MSTNSKHQADSILAQFPGPVVLHFSRRRVVFMLVIYLTALAFMLWLLTNPYPWERETMSARKDLVLVLISILFWGTLAVRALVILLRPDAASLTLSADGFVIGHVFRRIRLSWRDVGEFAVMKRYLLPARYGGRVEQILYQASDTGLDKRKAPHVLADIYGRPRMQRADLTRLLNEWRRRAIAQAVVPVPGFDSPSRSRVPVINGARR